MRKQLVFHKANTSKTQYFIEIQIKRREDKAYPMFLRILEYGNLYNTLQISLLRTLIFGSDHAFWSHPLIFHCYNRTFDGQVQNKYRIDG
jgi:hypothetical protein